MFETVALAVTTLVIGAVGILAAVFIVLAATPQPGEERPSRFLSPSMAQAWDSARLAAGRPVGGGMVNALVRGLMEARAALHGIFRHADW